MIEFLVFCLLAIVGVILAVAGIILLPLVLLGLLFKALLFVVMLPFRLLGVAVGVIGSVLVGVGHVLFYLFAGLFGLLVFVGALVAVPLLPILLIGLAIWAVARLVRPRPRPVYAPAPHR